MIASLTEHHGEFATVLQDFAALAPFFARKTQQLPLCFFVGKVLPYVIRKK